MKLSIFLYSRGLFHNSEEAGMLVQAFLHDVSSNYAKIGTKWKRRACLPLLVPCPMNSYIQRLNNPSMVYMPDRYKQQKWTSDGAICFSFSLAIDLPKDYAVVNDYQGSCSFKDLKAGSLLGWRFCLASAEMSGKGTKTRVSLCLFRPFPLTAHLSVWQTSYEAGSKAEPNWPVRS